MAGRKNKHEVYEEREVGSRTPVMILGAIIMFGLAALLLYMSLAVPQAGTAMGSIRNIMRGLGGNLFILLPFLLVWGGILFSIKAFGKRVSVVKVIFNLILLVCLFTAVQLFFVERIMRENMTINEFANFVDKSYMLGMGGGAVGALLAWPLYRFCVLAGGLIATVLIALLCLTITGRLQQFIRWTSRRAGDAHYRSQQRRTEKKLDHMFDYNELDVPSEPSVPRRDPHSEDILSGTGPSSSERPKRRPRPAASAQSEAPVRPVRTAKQSPAPDEEMTRPVRKARSAFEDTEKPAAKAEPVRSAASSGKRKKLYNENIEKTSSVKEAEETVLDPEELFEVEESDASPAEEKLSRNRAARSFKPDRSESVEKALGKNETRSSEETSIPVVKANKKNNVKIEDLVIEPDEYEQPDDDDEAPFDIPEPVPAKKKDFPKLKRTPAPEPVEDAPPEYNYPPIDLLAEGESEDTAQHRQADMEKAQLLEDTLKSFGISSRLIGIAHGPAVTRFELQPAPGVKVSRITSLADDIALNLAAMTVRIEAPIPGKAAVGVEIPNDKIEMVRLRDVLESQDARRHASRIAVGLGKDNSGRYIVADIAKMPHVLIAGQTGSGKSVCINSIITSILFRASPEEVRLILIDPKVVELSIYNDIPHLVCPVVTDPKKAASALDWAVAEMSARYKKFAERGVRNIKGYNKALKPGEPIMPQMVIIIDELADLMMVSPGEVEDSICRLAQLARAAGMHLVIATQRPSVNVITGIIKANIPTRIAFSVASQVDSRTMIDHGGAEKLLGNGDMLFVPAGTSKPMRVQGAWVSDEEVNAIVDYIKESSETTYDQDMLEHMENAVRTDAEREEFAEEYDPKLPEAVDIVIEAGQASISMLQRRMRVGYARAGRLIDEMAQRGIISEADGAKPRTVLISREEAAMMFED